MTGAQVTRALRCGRREISDRRDVTPVHGVAVMHHQRSPSRPGRFVAVLVAAWIVLMVTFATAAPAFAHAEVVAASPEPGTGRPQAPGAVVLKFTEKLNLDLSRIQIDDRDGRDVGVGETLAVEGDPSAMRRGLGLLQPGAYTVRWTSVSSVDGHTLKGSYLFGIGDAPLGNEQVQSSPLSSESWLGLVGSFLAFVGLGVWSGSLL